MTKKLVSKKSRFGPAAPTNQIRPFSYWLCESRSDRVYDNLLESKDYMKTTVTASV